MYNVYDTFCNGVWLEQYAVPICKDCIFVIGYAICLHGAYWCMMCTIGVRVTRKCFIFIESRCFLRHAIHLAHWFMKISERGFLLQTKKFWHVSYTSYTGQYKTSSSPRSPSCQQFDHTLIFSNPTLYTLNQALAQFCILRLAIHFAHFSFSV